MPNKEHTNEDIISSLEIIATTRNCNECKIRNCKWGTCNCSQITANAALDLINRQKAEIEKLEGSTIVSNIMESQRIKREAKAEAIKKFATKFLEKIHEHHYWLTDPYNSKDYGMFTTGIEQAVNETKKEMVGEE